jgi:hypothetical protein
MNRYIASQMSIEQSNYLWASLSQGLNKNSHKQNTIKKSSKSTHMRKDTLKKENKV